MTYVHKTPKIVGILNVTADSFSDGKRFLDKQAAIEKGLDLVEEGADIVDIGAESSNPEGEKITAEEEIERLAPVIKALKGEGCCVSVDTYKPEVMQCAVSLGADMINDITGLRDKRAIQVIQGANIPVVIMFARNIDAHAQKTIRDHKTVMSELSDFFTERLKTLQAAGIPGDNIIIDPGMGFFLGGNPEPSLMGLRHIGRLKEFNQGIYLSVSRKSFIGTVLDRPIEKRGIGTLAVEMWACFKGVDYIRTHDPAQLRDAIRMIQAIERVE